MREIFKKRHSVRKFKTKEVVREKLEEVLRAANSAPSAGGLESREIIVAEDKEIRGGLAEAAFGQEFIAKAPIVLVFCALPEKSAAKYGGRGRDLYSIQDATIAASFAWLQAVDLGLSSCWVGAFNEKAVKEVLGLGENSKPVAILPLGYSAEGEGSQFESYGE